MEVPFSKLLSFELARFFFEPAKPVLSNTGLNI